MMFNKFVFCVFFLSVATFSSVKSQGLVCRSTAISKCKSVAGYVAPNATTLANITTLFGVTDFNSLLGANNLPIDTPQSKSVAANETIKIPFTCSCNNGTGISDRSPVYTVKAGDGLDHIARNIFSLLVTYQEIAAVNNISDANSIVPGQSLRIPLPCSCDDVDEIQVVHYVHVVPPKGTLEMIVDEFGATEESLLKLNNLTDAKELKAESVLDVPLRACTSMVSNASSDYPLLLSDGTYTYTANNCIKCTCDLNSQNWNLFPKPDAWTLYCEPSSPADVKVQNWQQCPSSQCTNVYGTPLGKQFIELGAQGSCPNYCAYTGYNNQSRSISTTVANVSDCTVSPWVPSGSSKMSLQHWNFLRLTMNLGLLLCNALI
ncbi:lysM domain-containing GPI-anchored protein 2-like [Papaver somniferum]|uniref:lysM domain-containing GPI-anchored protein 2-like n=1 Tax=Papaver somniferum TaxID=3469 RepID=UPI000E6F65E3|nr:lysM domain-containing GPI-anchored protein 2-like [Papaver somniferum]